MTITLSPKNYAWMRTEIDACRRGEMCKIMKVEDRATKETWYEICADVTEGGWTTRSGRAFHPVMIDETSKRTGLGTFYYIRDMMTDSGGCLMEFTDDLNPDLP